MQKMCGAVRDSAGSLQVTQDDAFGAGVDLPTEVLTQLNGCHQMGGGDVCCRNGQGWMARAAGSNAPSCFVAFHGFVAALHSLLASSQQRLPPPCAAALFLSTNQSGCIARDRGGLGK